MIQKLIYLKDYFKYLKNPFSCLLFKIGIKKTVIVKFKKSKLTVFITDKLLLNKIMACIPFIKTDLDDYITFINELTSSKEIIPWGNNVNIFNLPQDPEFYFLPFHEYYMDDHYKTFNIDYKNRIVIDIGSFVGDTALFFASEGANVYGFEPVKENFEYCLKLRELNTNLKNNLQFFNLGVSDKCGEIYIDDMESTSNFRNVNDSYKVNVTTIENILNENDIEPDILKMDCEGCEFNIILNSDLSNFKDILFEHHAVMVGKEYKLLIEKLKEQGFKISYNQDYTKNFENIGLIHAYK